MNLIITKVTVIKGSGPDRVYLDTNLPSPTPNFCPAPLCFSFDAADGVDYVVHTLGVNPGCIEVVTRPKPSYKFSQP